MKKILLTTALLVGASTASAATVDFDFMGVGEMDASSLSYSSNGVGLTLTGIQCGDFNGPNSKTCSPVGLDERTNGIGIDNGSAVDDDSRTIDGHTNNQFIQMTFDTSVTLDELFFSRYNENDTFLFYTWNEARENWTRVGRFTACETGCEDVDPTDIQTYEFPSVFEGTTFYVGAGGGKDDWMLAGLTAIFEPEVAGPAVVPLPAAGWMLLAGLGGLVAAGRRKSA